MEREQNRTHLLACFCPFPSLRLRVLCVCCLFETQHKPDAHEESEFKSESSLFLFRNARTTAHLSVLSC